MPPHEGHNHLGDEEALRALQDLLDKAAAGEGDSESVLEYMAEHVTTKHMPFLARFKVEISAMGPPQPTTGGDVAQHSKHRFDRLPEDSRHSALGLAKDTLLYTWHKRLRIDT